MSQFPANAEFINDDWICMGCRIHINKSNMSHLDHIVCSCPWSTIRIIYDKLDHCITDERWNSNLNEWLRCTKRLDEHDNILKNIKKRLEPLEYSDDSEDEEDGVEECRSVKIFALENEIESQDKELNEAYQKIQSLQKEIDDRNSCNFKMTIDLADTKADNEKIHKHNYNLSTQLMKLANENTKLSTEVFNLKERLNYCCCRLLKDEVKT